ncbi:MAG: glycosyltransferase [Candidatus Omnitrophica bacterium]|nr:glycosyltransferase [Candidatus Omnitrophota bacterium]
MKILFITQFFYPDIQATSKIFRELCEDLAKTFCVNVVCGQPLVEARRNRSRTAREEDHEGFHISRVFSARRVKKTKFNRFVNHVSYFFGALWKCLFLKQTDLVIFTSDNPLNVLIAVFFFRTRKVYLNQDLYAEQGRQVGALKGLLLDVVDALQTLSYRISDRVIVIGETMGKYLIEEKGVPPGKVIVISNWADTEKIQPLEKDNAFAREHGITGDFIVMHSGRLGLTQNIEMLLECARELKEYPDIRFLIIGEGEKRGSLKKTAREMSLENVMFLQYQSEEDLNKVFSSADVTVILYNTKLSHSLVPSRLYSFMACSRPVVASIDADCSACKLIKKSECGIAIELSDAAALKDSIIKLYKDYDLRRSMGRKGREYVSEHVSRKLMTDKYRCAIEELMGEEGGEKDEQG